MVQPGGYCPICNVSGDNKAQVFTACFTLGNYQQCDHDEFCGVEIRQRMTEVTGLRVTCAKVELSKTETATYALNSERTMQGDEQSQLLRR